MDGHLTHIPSAQELALTRRGLVQGVDVLASEWRRDPTANPFIERKVEPGLSTEEHQALTSALREGLGQAARAERCLTDDDLQQGDVEQFLGYLSTAIEQLDQARDIVRRMT